MSGLLPLPNKKRQHEANQTGSEEFVEVDISSIERPRNDLDDVQEESKEEELGPEMTRARTASDYPNDDEDADGGDEDGDDDGDSSDNLHRPWFRMRPPDDDDPEDWWFASTAIPLLAATIGPLANVLSIASIVSKWRVTYDPTNPSAQDSNTGIDDPRWEITLNAVSLACGFVGNLFLLFNFTRAVRYIVALPMTIIMWYISTGLLLGTLAGMVIYNAPDGEASIWGQAFWYAVMAAALYTIAAMLLMVNMLGYFLGHYTQHFELTEEQRNLILQTMMFFTWLAGGAGIFSKTCGWSYSDALYFCDVTILTVGFGDYVPPNDLGRGLVLPYSVGGIITLGLVIASVSKFAAQIGHTKIVHKRIEARRARTVERSVTTSLEAKERYEILRYRSGGERPQISAPFDPQKRTIAFDNDVEKGLEGPPSQASSTEEPSRSSVKHSSSKMKKTFTKLSTISEGRGKQRKFQKFASRKPKLVILKEERDRFNAMRAIQNETRRFKQYFALAMSVAAFGILWCVGAVVFWQAEAETQDLSYFEALYFCYVSLLTIGYGDLSPKSNAGKPFFVVWSLIAVPTMTILISDLGDTVIAAYKRGTFRVADWSIMPKKGLFASLADKYPRLKIFLEGWQTRRRIQKGFDVGPEPAPQMNTIEQLAAESNLDEHDTAKRLARAIRQTADDLKAGSVRRYTYEEWVEFTRLIRFTTYSDDPQSQLHADEQGQIEWDWIGENSPMMADQHECEWVLDRLCESLDRYMHKMVPEHVKERRRSHAERRRSLMEGRRSFVGRRSLRSRRDSISYRSNTPEPGDLTRESRSNSIASGLSRSSGPQTGAPVFRHPFRKFGSVA